MKRIPLYYSCISFLIFLSCKKPSVKHEGFNDLVVGSQKIVLYNNNEFFLEMSLGGTYGTYIIRNDTVILYYERKPSETWPSGFTISKDFFESVNSDSSVAKTKIRRLK